MSFHRDSTYDNDLIAAWQELAAQAKGKPWLLKLLAQQGAALAARWALWKQRLSRLRLGEQRRLRRQLGVGLAGAALLLALAGGPAGASPSNTITVTGSCDLVEAMENANDTTTGQPNTDCGAGNPAGADVIDLQTDVTLTAPHNSTPYGPTGLPVVTSAITINGNGRTIERDSMAPDFRILAVGPGGNLTLNSATISGGVLYGNHGGGIYARSASVTVSDSTFSGNSALLGGGIFARSASLTISNSALSANSAGQGGGINALSSTVTISNSILSGNSASGGGGIYADSATVTVSNSTLSGNSARTGGGGILVWYSATVSVSNSTLSNNSANQRGGGLYARSAAVAASNSTLSGNSAASGGGIYARRATLTVSNSILSGNSAGNDGGALDTYASTVTTSNSTLSGNSASNDGGALYTFVSTVTISNSTLTGNSAGDGGGFYARSASVAVVNSTLSGNSAGSDGGGIYAFGGALTVSNSTLYGNRGFFGGGIYARSAAAVTLQRSLVSGNRAGATQGNEVFNNASTITAANFNLFGHSVEDNTAAFYNFIPSGTDINATSSGTNTTLASILVTTLANNGVQPHPDTHALVSGSPAIDRAPSASCTAAPINTIDQRGGLRNIDGDGSASSNECDIGAFEYGSTQTPNAVSLQSFTATGGSGGSLPGQRAALLPLALGGLGLSAFLAARHSRRPPPRDGICTAPILTAEFPSPAPPSPPQCGR